MSEPRRLNPWVTGLLIAALVAIFVIPLYIAPRPTGEGDEAFGGTDAKAVEVLETDHGATAWFEPIFEPGSSEVESGLFALQAALGAGAFGYVIGRLQQRSITTRREDEAPVAERVED
ncbi:hypothetical protein GCM10027418_05340 [Mariniluteicoccus endophyticus]